MKQTAAIFFGGRSPEHDVSIVTGLQVMDAIDQGKFDVFPVYVSTDGEWLVGNALRERGAYLPRGEVRRSLSAVTLEVGANPIGRGRLLRKKRSRWTRTPEAEEFDIAVLAFHGQAGEDGRIQSLFDVANIPYTGVRHRQCGILMDKAATKMALAALGVPVLPHVVVERPENGGLPSPQELEKRLASIGMPAIIKPLHLGSSIGVARVTNIDEARASMGFIFRLDTHAIVEPFVENLVEYNVSATAVSGEIALSAIERPKRSDVLLDFKTKYMTGAGSKGGQKTLGQHSQGMLSLTRDIHPEMPEKVKEQIVKSALCCFSELCQSGAPRIDFLSNEKTGEVWLNEVNPCPGSYGFYLWEAANPPMLFTQLLNGLIDEALKMHRLSQLPGDLTPSDARLFPRD